jgi:hypothetical protein
MFLDRHGLGIDWVGHLLGREWAGHSMGWPGQEGCVRLGMGWAGIGMGCHVLLC